MLVAIHRHKLLVEGNAPKPLFNTEFHSVATRSANAFLSVPSAPFRSIGVRESLTPFANRVRPKIEPPSKDGVVKYHPISACRKTCFGNQSKAGFLSSRRKQGKKTIKYSAHL